MRVEKLLKTGISKICNLYNEIDMEVEDTWFAWGYFFAETNKKVKVALPNKFGKTKFKTKEEAKEAINYFKKHIYCA